MSKRSCAYYLLINTTYFGTDLDLLDDTWSAAEDYIHQTLIDISQVIVMDHAVITISTS